MPRYIGLRVKAKGPVVTTAEGSLNGSTAVPARLKARSAAMASATPAQAADPEIYGSVMEIAEVEKVNKSDVGRTTMIVLLAPSIVQALVDWRQPKEITQLAWPQTFP